MKYTYFDDISNEFTLIEKEIIISIEVRDITGYGSIEGFAEDRSGEGYCWAVS